jgi:hypothetical protein
MVPAPNSAEQSGRHHILPVSSDDDDDATADAIAGIMSGASQEYEAGDRWSPSPAPPDSHEESQEEVAEPAVVLRHIRARIRERGLRQLDLLRHIGKIKGSQSEPHAVITAAELRFAGNCHVSCTLGRVVSVLPSLTIWCV